jgi:phosphoribosylglycinamide formyltransferase-1
MKLAVLASGNGTNLQAIIDAIKDGTLQGTSISYVVSDHPDSGAIGRAQKNNITTVIVRKGNMVGLLKPIFEEVDLVVLAGFLKILPMELLGIRPIINIHPSLLPFFGGKGMYGLNVHEEVLKSGMKVTGATVHFVTEDIDGGPIIMQKCMQVEDHDTPESLQERIHHVEHEILIQCIRELRNKNYKIVGKRVIFP